MKQIVWLYTLLGLLSLNAFELEIDMGTGFQYTGANGKLVYKKDFWEDSSAGIDHESSPSLYIWSEFKLDQAYWPKLRLEFTNVNSEGKSFIHINSTDEINALINAIEDKLSGVISINNTYYDSHLAQSTYEGYLYYEYFEKSDYPSVGFGLGVKTFDFAYNATLIDGLEFTDSGGDTIPLLFFKSRYELEKEEDGVQLSFEGNAKVYIFGDSNIYDYMLKTDFMMEYNQDTDLGIEFGYRYSVIDIKGSDITTVGGNMTNSGVFFGAVAHFR